MGRIVGYRPRQAGCAPRSRRPVLRVGRGVVRAGRQPSRRGGSLRGRCVVLASPRHAHGFAAWLAASGVDVDAAVADGTYRVLDARETLERFLVNGHPDARRFDDVVGAHVRSAAATGRRVYAYGEMVALLWDDGRVNAAIELETLWNDLGLSVPFSLFCAYPSSSVTSEDQAELLSQVCCLHTAVLGADAQHRSTRQFEASSNAPPRHAGSSWRRSRGSDASR